MREQPPQSPHSQGPAGAYAANSYAAFPPEERRKGLESKLDFVYRQRLVILLVTVVVVAAAVAYVYTRTPTYVATSLVRVDLAERARTAPEAEVAVADVDIFATNDRPLLAEVFLLQTSNRIRQRVAERLEELGVAGPEARAATAAVTFDVADEAANTILISVGSWDPQRAALLADLYADTYVQLTEEAGRDRLAAQRSVLEEREQQQRQDLAQIEAEQQARAVRGSTLNPAQGGYVAVQIANLEGQRDEIRTQLYTRRASLQAAEADLAALEPGLAQRVANDDEQRLQSLQDQVAALRAERTQTERRYPDAAQRDARVTALLQQLDADIQRLDAEVSQLSQRIIASGGLSGGETGGAATLAYASQLRQRVREDRATIEALEQQATRIETRLAQQYAELRRLPGEAMAMASQQIAQAQIERDRMYAAQTYEEAANQLRAIQAAEEGGTGYARIIQNADVPSEPSQIPTSLLLVLGTFIGLSLGFGLALVRDKVDNRILKPEQLREWGYPVLATIPNLAPLIKEQFGGQDHVEVGGRRLSSSLVTLLSPMSPTAEAYRHLRTNVLAGGGTPVKVLLVTSPGAGDGKSTTAANLAIAMAQGGHRTLLLDADLRRSNVHKLFGVPRSPGLIQHLLGERRGEPGTAPDGEPEALNVGIDDLFIIPAGEAAAMGDGAAPSAAPATALGTAVTASYLQWLRGQFDVVVIDTPPVLATTDALQLASQCDAVVVTTRAKQTREGELSHVLEALEQVGAPIAGTVLNGFDVSMAYGYKYRYRSYTEYGLYPDYGAGEGEGDDREGKGPSAQGKGSSAKRKGRSAKKGQSVSDT